MREFERKQIGQRIGEARKRAGFTQDQLADMLGLSKRVLQEYEAGNIVPWKYFRQIAELTNVDQRWLIYGEEEEVATPPDEKALEKLRGEMGALREEVHELADEVRRRLPSAEPESPL